ncbi:hypothetical protein SKAU_G00277400 [Synaphobranchus kaupii]|uniref:Uncharacterized protein n=1 Tax=Synaphobranchus kaupii TaxID=118154 RepID=A0A9Q1F1W7_SYNKA|nr:hypothetical protein SKAU_G00277400 [Synaphobranchus kaupii]
MKVVQGEKCHLGSMPESGVFTAATASHRGALGNRGGAPLKPDRYQEPRQPIQPWCTVRTSNSSSQPISDFIGSQPLPKVYTVRREA